jgi:hypothetical protein
VVVTAYFWIKRFIVALVLAFTVICAAHLLRGRDLRQSVTEAAIWGVISATVFTIANHYRVRRGQQCALCGDPPVSGEKQRDR